LNIVCQAIRKFTNFYIWINGYRLAEIDLGEKLYRKKTYEEYKAEKRFYKDLHTIVF